MLLTIAKACLDRLCDPFMDATFSKIDRIDANYLKRNPRISIQDETKINADQKTADEFYSQKAEGTNNFISEIFFLTVAAHHYGTEATSTQLEQRQKEVKHLQKDLEQFEAERERFLRVRVVCIVTDLYQMLTRIGPPICSQIRNHAEGREG